MPSDSNPALGPGARVHVNEWDTQGPACCRSIVLLLIFQKFHRKCIRQDLPWGTLTQKLYSAESWIFIPFNLQSHVKSAFMANPVVMDLVSLMDHMSKYFLHPSRQPLKAPLSDAQARIIFLQWGAAWRARVTEEQVEQSSQRTPSPARSPACSSTSPGRQCVEHCHQSIVCVLCPISYRDLEGGACRCRVGFLKLLWHK